MHGWTHEWMNRKIDREADRAKSGIYINVPNYSASPNYPQCSRPESGLELIKEQTFSRDFTYFLLAVGTVFILVFQHFSWS